ncbi:MAG: cell division protein FtsL [Treponema sp.]|nr:cell division protein FtsL [Treponema sp.]MBR7080574.1 cell division protein FtsL [Treponema sp.]
MSKVGFIVRIVFVCLAAISIPAMLMIDAVQARKYTDLKNQVIDLEEKQSELIEENKKLITDISLLSSADRIERLASEELGMRKAETDEIIRVEMKDTVK